MIRVGVIGYGYWGPNLVRNFHENSATELVAISDTSLDRLALAQKRYPSAYVTRDYRELLADVNIDAVAVVTPVSTHFELGMQVLKSGRHLLIEKPMTATSEQALVLIEEAE